MSTGDRISATIHSGTTGCGVMEGRRYRECGNVVGKIGGLVDILRDVLVGQLDENFEVYDDNDEQTKSGSAAYLDDMMGEEEGLFGIGG